MNPALRNKTITGFITIVAITLVAIGTKELSAKQTASLSSRDAAVAATKTTITPAATPSASTTTPSSSVNQQVYKDGMYTATGAYLSPGGDESITISLTLQHDTITASTAQSGANDPTAVQYQSAFIDSYKPVVVGKSLDAVQVTVVSGSSLTSQGFANALEQIKRQAKS